MELPPEQKLANLKNMAELWSPEDITYADFVEFYVQVAIALFDEADEGVSSDYTAR